MTEANICHAEATNSVWDAIVIGAGPAGAVAARQAARAGYRTLLVDKQAFPRPKVCGACVNARAIEVLTLLGLGSCVAQLPSASLNKFALHCGRHQAAIPLPTGKAISRSALDDALVREARDAGAKWLPETMAAVGNLSDDGRSRLVELTGVGSKSAPVSARVVLVADGLGSPSLKRREEEFPAEVSEDSRVGLGGILAEPAQEYANETIHMAVSRYGYVGLVRLHDGSLNIAAAVDAAYAKRHRTVHSALDAILADAKMAALDLRNVVWKGTPPLTRKIKRPASKRVLVLGDAAGYEEPFTGEGIAWAITSGAAAATLVPDSISSWSRDLETRWIDVSRSLIQQHQVVCRLLAKTLRSYRLSVAATRLLAAFPACAAPLVARSTSLPSHVERFLSNPVRASSVTPQLVPMSVSMSGDFSE